MLAGKPVVPVALKGTFTLMSRDAVDTGTGNTVNVDHPMVLRMIMDSLRYWVEVMHVDGFRFDLASILGRGPDGGRRRAR